MNHLHDNILEFIIPILLVVCLIALIFWFFVFFGEKATYLQGVDYDFDKSNDCQDNRLREKQNASLLYIHRPDKRNIDSITLS